MAHARKFGQFRTRHVALARGGHRRLGEQPYVGARVDAASGERVRASGTLLPEAAL